MATATEFTETVQDGILKALETSQRVTLEALSAAVSTIDGILPERPNVPFATALVTPKETLDNGFRFAERLLESQKAFLEELVTIAAPTAPTAPPAPKRTA
jgi:hypothetical protein